MMSGDRSPRLSDAATRGEVLSDTEKIELEPTIRLWDIIIINNIFPNLPKISAMFNR